VHESNRENNMVVPSFSYANETQSLPTRVMIRLIEKLTGQAIIHKIYLHIHNSPEIGESFWKAYVRYLDLTPKYSFHDICKIPATGPVVIVANHPYGVLDGLIMCSTIEEVRKDFRILTNELIVKVPEVSEALLPVDFSGTKEALKINIATRDTAQKYLENGGCVVIFPAGGISTSPDKLGKMPAIDSPWHPFTTKLIRRSNASVVPIYFYGQNSRLFQIASHIHLVLRMSLIFKEVYDRIGTDVHLAIGEPIGKDRLDEFTDKEQLLNFLRERVYNLKEESNEIKSHKISKFGNIKNLIRHRIRRFKHLRRFNFI